MGGPGGQHLPDSETSISQKIDEPVSILAQIAGCKTGVGWQRCRVQQYTGTTVSKQWRSSKCLLVFGHSVTLTPPRVLDASPHPLPESRCLY